MPQIDFCAKCNKDTVHELVYDPIFKIGIECLTCETVWEAEYSYTVKEVSKEPVQLELPFDPPVRD